MAANLTVAVKAAAVASGERKQLASHGEAHSRSSSRPSSRPATQSSSRSTSSSISRFGQSGSRQGGKNVPYLTVDEVLAKSKAWHAARGEAASPSGGTGNSNSTALAAGAEAWNGSYMRKQFPPSWFLTGDYSKVGYGMGSPVPLSYHGNHEMLSYLPEILQPRHQPLEPWSPEAAAAAATANKRAANANSSGSAGRPETQPSGRKPLSSRGRGVGAGGGGGGGSAGGVAGAGEGGGDTQHEVKFTNNDSRRGKKQAGLPAL